MPENHAKEFLKFLEVPSRRYSGVFEDFCAMAAISLSNPFSIGESAVRDAREQEYLRLIGKYAEKEERDTNGPRFQG